MFIPSGFAPSRANVQRQYDSEGRLREVRIDSSGASSGDPGIAQSNSLFATDAELFGTITPFLKRARLKDAKRRNYVIQPGGACLYSETDQQLADPYNHGQVRFDMPTEQESFGHYTQPDATVQPPALGFRVGGA